MERIKTIILKEFLAQKHSTATIKTYMRSIEIFVNTLGEEKAQQANYNTIVAYVQQLHQQYSNAVTVKLQLGAIKNYYKYLQHIGKRKDHPCSYLDIRIPDWTAPRIDSLLNKKDLQLLVEKSAQQVTQAKDKNTQAIAIRNKLMISMFIYQALTLKEVLALGVYSVDIIKGEIDIQTENSSRILPLQASQILLAQTYLKKIRPYLLKKNNKENTQDIWISFRGNACRADNISIMLKAYSNYFNNKHVTVTRIRQSVITHLLQEGKDIRLVQSFAGHKQAHSTEKYKYNNISQLQGLIEQYHPLK